MTPCQPLTARTDDLYQIVYYFNLKLPRGHLPRVKDNNRVGSARVLCVRYPLRHVIEELFTHS